MSRQNVEVVRRVMSAWDRGETDRFVQGLDAAVELVTDAVWPGAGTSRGPEQVVRFLEDYRQTFQSRVMTVEEVVDAGDRVLMRIVDNVTGRTSGVPTENRFTTVCTVRHGKIARIEYFSDHGRALQAVGLRE